MAEIAGQIFLGKTELAGLFYGSPEVSAAFIGRVQLWPINSVDPSEDTLYTEDGIPFVDEFDIVWIDSDERIIASVTENTAFTDTLPIGPTFDDFVLITEDSKYSIDFDERIDINVNDNTLFADTLPIGKNFDEFVIFEETGSNAIDCDNIERPETNEYTVFTDQS